MKNLKSHDLQLSKKECVPSLKKAIAYIRAAHFCNDGIGTTICSQINEIATFSQKNDYTVVQSFSDVGSHGQCLDRFQFQNLLRFVDDSKGEISYLIVSSPCRISRRLDDFIGITRTLQEKHSIKIISINSCHNLINKYL
jgi:DNA invertase Pin-like site-specific DNA recombinase